uniref:Uncharacterized protein n=1 Tax=Arundo donax TaxID=35708 RepID=A0A0A8YG61_ARUDO
MCKPFIELWCLHFFEGEYSRGNPLLWY